VTPATDASAASTCWRLLVHVSEGQVVRTGGKIPDHRRG